MSTIEKDVNFGSLGSKHSLVTDYENSFETNSPISAIIPGPDGELIFPNGRGSVHYVKDFFAFAEANTILTTVQNSPAFRRTAIQLAKQGTFLQPRDTAFFGSKLYSYGGEKRQPIGWMDEPPASTTCHQIASKLESFLNLDPGYFNVVLVNKYNGGSDFMEWHSDNERNLGDEPIIASLSIGAEREFLIRPRRDGMDGKPVDVIKYSLAHGSLLVMSGKMQRFYQHAVPKSKDENIGIRLNFTFRKVEDENDFTCHPTEG